jgi:hypothetical protein
MRRVGTAIAFLLVGLFTTWLACWIGSHMAFRLGLGFEANIRGTEGCYEMGLCSVPWWVTTVFLMYILGPSVVFAIVGGWLVVRERRHAESHCAWQR